MTENTPRSVQQSRRGITVSASPFNGVKLELGVIVVLMTGVIIGTETWVAQAANQFLIFGAASTVCASWLMFRIRQVMRNQATDSDKID